MRSMDDRLEQIGRDARAARELGEGTVAVLGEILGVLREIQADLRGMAEFQFEALQDLRDLGRDHSRAFDDLRELGRDHSRAFDDLRELGRDHSQGFMQILDRLGPGPGTAPA
jgi:hypothetical protein